MEVDLTSLEQKIRFVKEHSLFMCPTGVAIGEVSSTQQSSFGCLLHYSKSSIILQEATHECKIRVFTADPGLVYSIAYQELKALEVLNMMNIQYSMIGFNVIKYSNHVDYIVFRKFYMNLPSEIPFKEKMNIVGKIAIALYKMHNCNYFLGPFNKNSISIDQNHKIILDELFFVYCPKIISDEYKIKLGFINNLQQVAPEISLIYKNQNIDTSKMDHSSVDIFSLGIYAMEIFEIVIPDLSLKEESQSLFDEIVAGGLNTITQSLDNFRIHSIAELVNKKYSRCLELDLLKDCLKIAQKPRIKINALLENWPSLYLEITELGDESRLSKQEFEELVDLFGKTMSTLYLRHKQKGKNFDKFVVNTFKRFLNNKQTLFSKAINSFFDTNCYSRRIKCRDGIAYFIWTLCKNVKENVENSYSNWLEGLAKLPHISSEIYNARLYSILSYDYAIQDYVVTGLSAQTYQTDWSYFFPIQIDHITFSYYQRLIDCHSITQEFLCCLNHPTVKTIIKETVHVAELDEDNFFLEKVFPRVFLIKTQGSLHGLTTYNQNIFISSYAMNFSSPEYCCKGAIFLTLFHELCQFLRRFRCRTFKQGKSFNTPKSSSSSDLKQSLPYSCGIETIESCTDDDRSLVEMTEHEIYMHRGEAGDVLYEQLFDSSILSINDYAGRYLLTADFNDKERFARKFNIENNKGGQSVSIAKGSSKRIVFKGLRCGWKMDSFK